MSNIETSDSARHAKFSDFCWRKLAEAEEQFKADGKFRRLIITVELEPERYPSQCVAESAILNFKEIEEKNALADFLAQLKLRVSSNMDIYKTFCELPLIEEAHDLLYELKSLTDSDRYDKGIELAVLGIRVALDESVYKYWERGPV